MHNPKKILFLGASHIEIPPIQYAKEQGHYVITADYLPDNPGHRYADQYVNVSTTDKEAVLALAQSLSIDAVIAYASDPSAPNAAYVANQLKLPSNPYEAVATLTNKNKYRSFLQQHNFKTPVFIAASSLEEASTRLNSLIFPVMVKPEDSSGSQGVSKIYSHTELEEAFDHALQFSSNNNIIMEECITRSGYQITANAFIAEGEIAFFALANEHFNEACNPFVPIGESFPSQLPDNTQQQVIEEINRLLYLLGMRMGVININVVIDEHGHIYLMEIAPHNGGHLIPEVIRYSTGIDLIKHTVDAALGVDSLTDLLSKPISRACYASYIIHATQEDIFSDLYTDKRLLPHIVMQRLFIQEGEPIYPFNGSHQSIGHMILSFDSKAEMLEIMQEMPSLVYPIGQKANQAGVNSELLVSFLLN